MTTNPETGEVTVHSDDTSKVYAALVKAQRAAPDSLGKIDRNTFANFDYVSADRLVIAGRAALLEGGLVLLPMTTQLAPPVGQAVATLRAIYRLAHESGQWLELVYETPVMTGKGKPEDKGTFGSMTENLGYAYRGVLGIGRLDKDEVTDVSGRDDSDYTPAPPPSQTKQQPSGAQQLADEYAGAIASATTIQQLQAVGASIANVKLPDDQRKRLSNAYGSRLVELRGEAA